jgi:hypothetical protein
MTPRVPAPERASVPPVVVLGVYTADDPETTTVILMASVSATADVVDTFSLRSLYQVSVPLTAGS